MDRSHLVSSFSALALLTVTGPLAIGCGSAGESVGDTSSASTITVPTPSAFSLPPSDPQARAQILSSYAFVDPQGVVPRGLLEDALEYYDLNKLLVPNTTYVAVVDFSQFSGKYRFFLVDMTTGAVEQHKVAHGSGSDPNGTGYATIFSNTNGSHMSSLGFYMAGSIYDGTHPNSMYIYGLSADGSPNAMADTNVLAREVVVHPASYVSDSNSGAQGRSDGCFALDPAIELSIVQRLTNGALIYAEKTPLNPPIGRVSADGGVEAPVDAGDGWEDGGYGSCTTSVGVSGTCITTSACAAHGGTSTADRCPGPDDVQCCTGE